MKVGLGDLNAFFFDLSKRTSISGHIKVEYWTNISGQRECGFRVTRELMF